MKDVLVSKEFFDFKNKYSGGLISGMKKLLAQGCTIYIDEKLKIDDTFYSILKLEKIVLIPCNLKQREFDYIISNSSTKKKNLLNVGGKGKLPNFYSAVEFIVRKLRSARVIRKTKETLIDIELWLDGEGKSKINTGIGFFDHMLNQIARHGNIDLNISVKGDLHVDEHHTVEDTGIALGEAIRKALGNKIGIKRYGFLLPMDDSIAHCAIDLGGRHFLNFKCKFEREKVGEFPTELTEEFFRGISSGMLSNIYIRCSGKNDHHKIEGVFKAFAKALNEACRLDERADNSLPSTKGLL